MLSCHCLNVFIEIEGDLNKVTAETLGLSKEEIQDNFFKDILQVEKLININKTHSGLIETRNVGSWVIHCCINCDVHSHAVHREKGASCILVNSKLFGKEIIEKLRKTDKFSQLYKIIINSDTFSDEENTTNSYLPTEVENVIKGLKQVAADVLKDEAHKVEERIRLFSDQQYAKLNDLRDRAFKEQQILTKLIIQNNSNNTKPISTNSGMSNPQGMPSRLNEPLAAGSGKIITNPSTSMNPTHKHTPKRQKSCPIGGHINSFDTEGLFEFEGTDDFQSGTGSEVEESDLDENREDGVKIPKRGNHSTAIAKSLPMTIPAFLSQTSRNHGFEDVDEAPPVEHNMDIAASIKALAKSVHGDPVFGDLPKPRYTYI